MAKIMIVDDAAFMRMVIKGMVTEGGHEVVGEATNGAEAIQKYSALNPDLVTMDITMPEMDGIQALKGIRQIDPKAKIIMCSAMGQQSLVVEAISAGAKDFLVKPFQKEKVNEAIAKVMDIRFTM